MLREAARAMQNTCAKTKTKKKAGALRQPAFQRRKERQYC
jgi:hypothetical protein